MLINELPDDCLLTIFDCIQDLTDLVNCFKVCEKWRNLVVVRTKKVKYFTGRPNNSPDSVGHQSDEPFDVTFFSKWFPNLRIVDFCTCKGISIDVADKIIRDSKSLKGIIADKCSFWVCLDDLPRILMNANLEMLFTDYKFVATSVINENMKQLCLSTYSGYLPMEVAHTFPNLERLNITFCLAVRAGHYAYGPVMANLKIVELLVFSYRLYDWEEFRDSLAVMDLCPALQSAHINYLSAHAGINFNDSVKNANLQDLVIQFGQPIEWDDLRRLMSKYPNLKHLALRGTFLKDDHIKQLILLLPKLTLLDIRESPGVTQDAANFVQDYCKRYGRSIKFYFKKDDKQIEIDYPQSLNRPEQICRGFDFMEHCFFKSFNDLPHFLDPIDD
ncbi:uncharacterized protein LOC107360277 isoform X1 [Tetranychus urticae]|uniref:uncharacterized protein LOC107360277 isoform X1 n=1 Tax=Tetranychus urticae TaxID=32264 RepID=UPI00077BF45F|nr:uncharacterized protein LOC107360277 isoform X1 [Tetranychus urticae]